MSLSLIKARLKLALSPILEDAASIKRLSKIELIREYVADQQSQFERGETTDNTSLENPVNAHHFTNLDAFRAYVTVYLKTRQDLHHKDMTLLVRQLAPGPTGLPPEIDVFTKTVDWIKYEDIQADQSLDAL